MDQITLHRIRDAYYNQTVSYRWLGMQFGVSWSTIRAICEADPRMQFAVEETHSFWPCGKAVLTWKDGRTCGRFVECCPQGTLPRCLGQSLYENRPDVAALLDQVLKAVHESAGELAAPPDPYGMSIR